MAGKSQRNRPLCIACNMVLSDDLEFHPIEFCERHLSGESRRRIVGRPPLLVGESRPGHTGRPAIKKIGGEKYCPKCRDFRPVSEFGKNRANHDGLTAYCREHHRGMWQAWRERKNSKGAPHEST